MHEYSIIQALMEQVEALARENSAEKVTKVVVKIGVMSGVEAHLLQIAFDTFKEKSVCDGAEFVLNVQPLKLHCLRCDSENELDEISYACPSCKSLQVEVIDGEDMFLMSVEMQ